MLKMICKSMSNLKHSNEYGETLVKKLMSDILIKGVTCHEITIANLPENL